MFQIVLLKLFTQQTFYLLHKTLNELVGELVGYKSLSFLFFYMNSFFQIQKKMYFSKQTLIYRLYVKYRK